MLRGYVATFNSGIQNLGLNLFTPIKHLTFYCILQKKVFFYRRQVHSGQYNGSVITVLNFSPMLKESLSNACTRSSSGDILNPQANVACTSRIFHLEEMLFNVCNHGLSQLGLSQDHNSQMYLSSC